ncbi:hypothetical protein ACFQJ5_19405 [Halomicroarcula sp. GCM10025324]|uniref:hypothetical protein n=1 Tax=Halomicroarcula sp. GCM10025324 TaxID=3252667 RepID=UPI003606CC0C
MNQSLSETNLLQGSDGRARAIRSFVIALVGTPWLLFLEPARQIVSLEATMGAVGLGMIFGIVATVGLADVDLREDNNVTAVVVTLVCICVATIVLWVIIPQQHLGTMLQFVIAFMWAMPVTQLLFQYYRTP